MIGPESANFAQTFYGIWFRSNFMHSMIETNNRFK
jgi:hypothetical protein